VLFFVEPSAGVDGRSMRTLVGSPPPVGAALVVGPEGGWAPQEIELARTEGALFVTLGPLTLRAESVPVAAMAIFRMLWE
jgi:16S rRNA (uracil1498-N3)-methyltransferase